jgi:hypothetical protein
MLRVSKTVLFASLSTRFHRLSAYVDAVLFDLTPHTSFNTQLDAQPPDMAMMIAAESMSNNKIHLVGGNQHNVHNYIASTSGSSLDESKFVVMFLVEVGVVKFRC